MSVFLSTIYKIFKGVYFYQMSKTTIYNKDVREQSVMSNNVK